jgi:glycosyltransferase involved in cell wall biosynthesis
MIIELGKSEENHPESSRKHCSESVSIGSENTVPTVGDSSKRAVSIIVPTYNERENIEPLIERRRAVLDGFPFEILVVDDDSPDKTWRFVAENYTKDPRIRLIHRTEDTGLARAVTRGFHEASYDICVVIDADLQHPPETIPALLAGFDSGADIVIGSRYVTGGRIKNWSLFRRTVSRGALAIVQLALPATRGITDLLSGFFAIRRDLFDSVVLSPFGYKILLEVLVRCEPARVVETPYTFTDRKRGSSNLSPEEYIEFLKHVVMLRQKVRNSRNHNERA